MTLDEECARLREQVVALTLQLDDCAAALPGPRYMDPPDGGSVTVADQVRRMASHVDSLDHDLSMTLSSNIEAAAEIKSLTQERDALALFAEDRELAIPARDLAEKGLALACVKIATIEQERDALAAEIHAHQNADCEAQRQIDALTQERDALAATVAFLLKGMDDEKLRKICAEADESLENDSGEGGWFGYHESFARRLLAAVDAERAAEAVPVAWSFEIATARFDNGEYTNFDLRLTRYEPNSSEGSLRNVQALYASPQPAPDVAPLVEALRRIASGCDNPHWRGFAREALAAYEKGKT
jgi:hypothetical protein